MKNRVEQLLGCRPFIVAEAKLNYIKLTTPTACLPLACNLSAHVELLKDSAAQPSAVIVSVTTFQSAGPRY